MSAEAIKFIISDARESGLPEPEPLVTSDEMQMPYPVDALPSIMGDAVRAYQSYGQQPLPLVACSALSAASLTIQGLVNVARDKNLIGPVSLNIAVIAQSGERKTSCDKRVSKAVRQWEEKYRADHAEEAANARMKVAAHQAEKDGLLAKIKSKAGKADSIMEVE